MSLGLLEPAKLCNEAGLKSLGSAVATSVISVSLTYSMACTVLDCTRRDIPSIHHQLQPLMQVKAKSSLRERDYCSECTKTSKGHIFSLLHTCQFLEHAL